jgi:hypothetical protein
MYDKAGFWKKIFVQPLVGTFPQANSDLKNFFFACFRYFYIKKNE